LKETVSMCSFAIVPTLPRAQWLRDYVEEEFGGVKSGLSIVVKKAL
jgi:hypothetical protein